MAFSAHTLKDPRSRPCGGQIGSRLERLVVLPLVDQSGIFEQVLGAPTGYAAGAASYELACHEQAVKAAESASKRRLAAFNVQHAQCYGPYRDKLLALIESGFDDFATFNRLCSQALLQSLHRAQQKREVSVVLLQAAVRAKLAASRAGAVRRSPQPSGEPSLCTCPSGAGNAGTSVDGLRRAMADFRGINDEERAVGEELAARPVELAARSLRRSLQESSVYIQRPSTRATATTSTGDDEMI